MAEPIAPNASTGDGQGEAKSGNQDGALLAPLLPAGESVEQLLRNAQFFVPGGTPSQDFREMHRMGGRGAEEFYRERWRHDKVGPLASPDIPSLLLRDTDMGRIVRRSGGTIARDGQPLTTAGWRRIRRWRQEWLALPSQVIPAVTGPDQIPRPGIDGLRYLADLADTAGVAPRVRADADLALDPDRRPQAGVGTVRTVGLISTNNS